MKPNLKPKKAKREVCQIPKQASNSNDLDNKLIVATQKDNLVSIDSKYKNLVFFALCEFSKNVNGAFLEFLKVDKTEISNLIAQIDTI